MVATLETALPRPATLKKQLSENEEIARHIDRRWNSLAAGLVVCDSWLLTQHLYDDEIAPVMEMGEVSLNPAGALWHSEVDAAEMYNYR